MVRTYKQYVFIYECLLEEFHAGDTMTDATSIKPKYHEWTRKNTKTGQDHSHAYSHLASLAFILVVFSAYDRYDCQLSYLDLELRSSEFSISHHF